MAKARPECSAGSDLESLHPQARRGWFGRAQSPRQPSVGPEAGLQRTVASRLLRPTAALSRRVCMRAVAAGYAGALEQLSLLQAGLAGVR